MLDPKLNFESHINEVLKKLARFNGLMHRARDCFSESSLLRSYQTYCKPIIMYGLLAYGSAAKNLVIIYHNKVSSNFITTVVFFCNFLLDQFFYMTVLTFCPRKRDEQAGLEGLKFS